jgi:hypothetical protein
VPHRDQPVHLTSPVLRPPLPPPRWDSMAWWSCPTPTSRATSHSRTSACSRSRYLLLLLALSTPHRGSSDLRSDDFFGTRTRHAVRVTHREAAAAGPPRRDLQPTHRRRGQGACREGEQCMSMSTLVPEPPPTSTPLSSHDLGCNKVFATTTTAGDPMHSSIDGHPSGHIHYDTISCRAQPGGVRYSTLP